MMKRVKIALLAISLALVFILVYSLHFHNPFPTHMDEWHHITEAINLKNGDYNLGAGGLEIGFHVFLSIFLFFISSQNLVLIYKFFPAIWACLSALALFFLVYKKTENNFWISLLSVIFFASIKSNSNTGGLMFFTPLTFAIPFIYLFLYFFTEGLEKENRKFILISLAIMVFLLPIHAISVLFAIPILITYSLFYLPYIKREVKFFSLFLLIPLVGIIFYKIITHVSFQKVLLKLLGALQFQSGWGVLEIKMPLLVIYSLAGFIFAIIGLFYIYLTGKKHYMFFVIWPALIILEMIFYLITGLSYLVPYQRNITYFILAIPILSSLGLYYLIKTLLPWGKSLLAKKQLADQTKKLMKISAVLIICTISFYFVFSAYYQVPKNIQPYEVITQTDYDSLVFLAKEAPGKVMANPMLSEAVFPITGNHPVGTLYFYGNRKIVESFYLAKNCTARNQIIKQEKVKYVIAKSPINCSWTELYSKTNYIYKIN
jgi:hypothetical protein